MLPTSSFVLRWILQLFCACEFISDKRVHGTSRYLHRFMKERDQKGEGNGTKGVGCPKKSIHV